MNQNNPFFNFSFSVYKEKLKQIWPISILGLFAMVAMLTYKLYFNIIIIEYVFEKNYGYSGTTLTSMNDDIYMISVGLIALITGIFSYRFLNAKNTTTIMHSLPLTRSQLFFGNTLAGLTVSVAPVVINGLLMLPPVIMIQNKYEELVKKNYFDPDVAKPSEGMLDVNDVWRIMLAGIVVVLFIYAITCLAAVITGTSTFMTVTSIFLNTVIPGVYICSMVFCDKFLYGFDFFGGVNGTYMFGYDVINVFFDSGMIKNIMYTHPLILGISKIGIPLIPTTVYIVLSVAIVLIACALYRKSRIEKVGEPFKFKWAYYLVVFTVTFCGMAIISSIVASVFYSTGAFMIAMIISAVIFFILCQMILNRKLGILNRRFLHSGCIFAVIILIFISFTVFDISGYENRLPDKDDIQSINFRGDNIVTMGITSDDQSSTIKLDSPENIRQIYSLHKAIVKNISKYKKSKNTGSLINEIESGKNRNDDRASILIAYDLGGKKMSRTYDVPLKDIRDNKEIQKLFESKEYKNKNFLSNNSKGNIQSLQYYGDYDTNGSRLMLEREEALEFAGVLDKDYLDMTYDEMIGDKSRNFIFDYDVEYMISDKNIETGRYIMYTMPKSYARSISWLKEKGYYEDMYKDYIKVKKELGDQS